MSRKTQLFNLDHGLSETELDKVVQAYKSITKIRNNFQHALEVASNEEETRLMLVQAGQEMVAAAQAQDLDFETYSQIMEAVNNDEDLRRQLAHKLKEKSSC